MEPIILLGEPIFQIDINNPLIAPLGQLELCLRIREETQDGQAIYEKLRKEYLAITSILIKMEIDFRIVYSHPDLVDKQVINALIAVGCRLVQFPNAPIQLTAFPRDFGLDLPGICLLNPCYGELTSNNVKGRTAIVSPYGEGGRILSQGNVVLVGDTICRGHNSEPPQIQPLEDAGLRVGIIPNPICGQVEGDTGWGLFSTSDHLDRVSCLLKDKNGGLHLIVDPQIYSRPVKNPTGPAETIEKIRRACDPLNIEVHIPEAMLVPYSLGLHQFRDGRVLMTSGDEPVAEVIAKIVGSNNLFLTEIPIRYYPAWALAGVHCLIGEVPSVFFRKREPDEPLD